MKKVRVGLIGYGKSGSVFHAPLINAVDGLVLAKVVSSKPDKVHSDLPDVEVVPNVEDLLADSEIDLVVVTSPNTTHFSHAKLALESNKHVIVEKPFTNFTKDADELIALATEKKLLLSAFQNRRWDNDFLTVKKCIQEGLLGDIYIYEAHYDLFRPQVTTRWRELVGDGAGTLYDLGAHLIDQALHLFGLPKTVSADIMKQRPSALVDDYFHIVLGYGTLRVILQSGWVVKKSGPHFQVHGSKGSLIKYGLDSQEGDLTRGIRPGHPMWGSDKEECYAQLTLGRDLNVDAKVATLPGCYEAYYKGIYESVVNDAPLPVLATEARDTIKVIEYALQSQKEQRVIAFS
jgi:scyllo-inositol 2-dehydrogenase (NADP+)